MIGPTGEYPDGKINAQDEGELNLGIYLDGNVLIMDFGTSTKWIGLHKEAIENLILILNKKLEEIKRGKE